MADQPGANDPESTDDGEPAQLGAAAPITIGRTSKRSGGDGTGGEKPKRRLPKLGVWGAVILVVGLVGLAFVPAFASGLKKTPRNRVGISYGGGPIEGTHFQRIIEPGSSLFFNGLYDPLYLYPSDQVNYIISKQANVGAVKTSDSVVAPTQDRVQVTYQVAVYFKLNVDKLQQFHEQFGLRYAAYTTPGWNRLLSDTFRQQIESALQEETRRVDVAGLFSNADQLVTLQKTVQASLTQKLQTAMGGQFFCSPAYRPGGPCGNPTFVIKKVDVPNSVAVAFQNNRISAIQILTEQNKIAQRQAEAEQKNALNMTGEEWVKYQAIQAGKTTFWILPGGENVTLPANPAGTGATTTTTPSGG